MEASTLDLLIVGGGAVGLRAANAADLDPQPSIGVISKIYPLCSHTVAAEGSVGIVPQVRER